MSDLDPGQIYQDYLMVVNEMIGDREKHEREEPGCSAAPLCMGPSSVAALGMAAVADPMFPVSVILVAIGELSKARRERDELARRLDVQRDMYAGLTRNVEQLCEETDQLRGRAEMAEAELGSALAELTMWNDAADSIGPAGLPDME